MVDGLREHRLFFCNVTLLRECKLPCGTGIGCMRELYVFSEHQVGDR